MIGKKISGLVLFAIATAGLFLSAVSVSATSSSDVCFVVTLTSGGKPHLDGNVYETWEGQHIEIEVCARWNPPQGETICIWADPTTVPEGATVTPECACGIDQACCLFSWTPSVGQAGTYNVTFYAGYECYVPVSSYNITIIVHPAPTPGIRFSQIDFSFDATEVENSGWGRLEVDIDVFTESQGLEEGYLNGYTDAGWVIQNLLIQPLEGLDSIVTYFDLGIPEGTDISEISIYLEFTEEPLAEFHDGPRIEYPVDTEHYNAKGGGSGMVMTDIPRPPQPVIFNPYLESWHFKKPQGPNENVQCAKNQCFPMSIANSLQYLKNRYNVPVPHQHKPGLKGDNSLVGHLDTACDRTVTSRWDGEGVWFDDMLTGKFKYLKENGLADKLVHRHQGYGYGWVDKNHDGRCQKGELEYNQGTGSLPHTDFTSHGITSKDESVNGRVTFEWLSEQIKKCEDVEIVYTYEDHGGNIDGAHAVRVFGCGEIFGVPFILYKHDAIQTYKKYGMVLGDDVGLEEVFSFVEDIDGDGMLNLGSPDQEICFAMSESPRLPVWIFHPLRDGYLRVYATHDCETIGFLFDYVVKGCHTYPGYLPERIEDNYVNDLLFDFWDRNGNLEEHKIVYPVYDEELGRWVLIPLVDVFNQYIPEDLPIPFLGDPSGDYPEIYVLINLKEFLENPQPPQEEYIITDGQCEQLPGYIIGTTPIIFNPTAPPDEIPFSTEPLTGILWWDSELTTQPSEEEPCYPDVEIVKGIHFGKITSIITNTECPDLSDIVWSIKLEGGFVLSGADSTGTIESLPSGEQMTIQSDFVLGFGPSTIQVRVDDAEPVTANAFLLGPFIFVY